MYDKLKIVEQRYNELTEEIGKPEVIADQNTWRKLMKEHASMEEIVNKYKEYKQVKADIDSAKEMLNDKELHELAQMEIATGEEKIITIEEELKLLSQNNDNIKFFGFIKHEEVEKLQNECDFLINPRRPSGTYTKYSFPSKTVEYMLTAKPVIMYKLEAIPDEYDGYLNYLTADTAEKIAEELKQIFEKDFQDFKDYRS